MTDAGKIITLAEGWDNQIHVNAIHVLENILDGGLSAQNGKMFSNRSYITVYTTCYDMCTQRAPYNHSQQLYAKHGETIQNYLLNTVLPAIRDRGVNGGIPLLEELKFRWENHTIMNKWYSKFFTYLDRYYVEHQSLPSLSQAGLTAFKTNIYEHVKVGAKDAIIELIDKERDGEIINKDLILNTVKLYESMGMGSLDTYNNDLETQLLESTREFYAKKREEWIVTDSTPEYLIKAEQVLMEEKNRVKEYLNLGTEPKLLEVVEQEILEKVETQLLTKEGSGCKVLLANDKSEDLQRMFKLFSRLENGLVPMAEIVQSYIASMGHEVLNKRQAKLNGGEKDKNDDHEFIQSLLALHDKYLGVIKTDFSGHSVFQKALKDAFVDFVNKDVGKYTNAEFMSTYCDRVLKSGGMKLSEAEVEDNLEKVVQLFSYLAEKDRFVEIYRNQLAKRLLKTTNPDNEKIMIAKLKMQCGTQFTAKLEGMLNDLAVGSEQKSEFDSKLREGKVKMDFGVTVLTQTFWPTYKLPNLAIPSEMEKCLDMYKGWHTQKHAQRKLGWIFSLGTATVRAVYGKKTYDFQVTTLQAVALNALNSGKTMSFDELKKQLNLEDEIMRPLMHSLCCGKYKVVNKTSPGKKIDESTSFTANSKFSCQKRKVVIAMASLEESHNTKRVEEDRAKAIEASIVRVMKARKTLKHQQLVAEVLSQLAFFKPNPRLVKKRIEGLIEREYLERSSENANVYNYLA
jgi:cullin 1